MGYIPKETIDQIIDRCDIVEVVAEYIPLKKAGKNFKALSPFTHEKTASFIVSPDKQIYHCFSSGNGGNVVSFIMKMEYMDFPEAIRLLADRIGVSIEETRGADKNKSDARQAITLANELTADFYHQRLLTAKDKATVEARDYLKKRGVSLEIVKKFKLGFAPDRWDSLLAHLRKKDFSFSLLEKAGLIIEKEKKDGFYDRFRNRIVFPIFDYKGKCVGFGARALDDGGAKYINSPETDLYTKGHHLYGIHMAKEFVSRLDEVIVAEGYMDFIMPFQAGACNIAASLGTALTIEQIRLVRRYTRNIVMLFDTDKAGQAAMVRSLDLLIEEGMNVRIASLEKGEDPDSFIRKKGVEAFNDCIKSAEAVFDFKIKCLLGQYGTGSIEDRAKISEEMLPTINKFENAVIKSEYIKRLAEVLDVSQDALMIELNKVNGAKKNDFRKKVGQDIVPKVLGRSAEYNILKVMLEDQDLIPSTKKELDLADLRDDNIKKVINKVYEIYDEKRELELANLMNCFEDQEIQTMISRLLVEEDRVIGNIRKVHSDCLKRISSDGVKGKQQDFIKQMKEAKAEGDLEKLQDLTEKFNKLLEAKKI